MSEQAKRDKAVKKERAKGLHVDDYGNIEQIPKHPVPASAFYGKDDEIVHNLDGDGDTKKSHSAGGGPGKHHRNDLGEAMRAANIVQQCESFTVESTVPHGPVYSSAQVSAGSANGV